ncbi:hypothetical protein YC2023_058469 [Brassica napus]
MNGGTCVIPPSSWVVLNIVDFSDHSTHVIFSQISLRLPLVIAWTSLAPANMSFMAHLATLATSSSELHMFHWLLKACGAFWRNFSFPLILVLSQVYIILANENSIGFTVSGFNSQLDNQVLEGNCLTLMCEIVLEVQPTRRELLNEGIDRENFTNRHPFSRYLMRNQLEGFNLFHDGF